MERPIRIPAQTPDEWNQATRDAFDRIQPSTTGAARKPIHLPAVIAHHPTLLPPYLAWASAIALHGVLTRRDNALIALRTAFRCASEFEWGVHVESAQRAGALVDDDIERIAAGPAAPGWLPREAALLRTADELHERAAVTDATWAELRAHYDTAALLEITFVAGHYTMLSMVANVAGVPPEHDWQPLPTIA